VIPLDLEKLVKNIVHVLGRPLKGDDLLEIMMSTRDARAAKLQHLQIRQYCGEYVKRIGLDKADQLLSILRGGSYYSGEGDEAAENYFVYGYEKSKAVAQSPLTETRTSLGSKGSKMTTGSTITRLGVGDPKAFHIPVRTGSNVRQVDAIVGKGKLRISDHAMSVAPQRSALSAIFGSFDAFQDLLLGKYHRITRDGPIVKNFQDIPEVEVSVSVPIIYHPTMNTYATFFVRRKSELGFDEVYKFVVATIASYEGDDNSVLTLVLQNVVTGMDSILRSVSSNTPSFEDVLDRYLVSDSTGIHVLPREDAVILANTNLYTGLPRTLDFGMAEFDIAKNTFINVSANHRRKRYDVISADQSLTLRARYHNIRFDIDTPMSSDDWRLVEKLCKEMVDGMVPDRFAVNVVSSVFLLSGFTSGDDSRLIKLVRSGSVKKVDATGWRFVDVALKLRWLALCSYTPIRSGTLSISVNRGPMYPGIELSTANAISMHIPPPYAFVPDGKIETPVYIMNRALMLFFQPFYSYILARRHNPTDFSFEPAQLSGILRDAHPFEVDSLDGDTSRSRYIVQIGNRFFNFIGVAHKCEKYALFRGKIGEVYCVKLARGYMAFGIYRKQGKVTPWTIMSSSDRPATVTGRNRKIKNFPKAARVLDNLSMTTGPVVERQLVKPFRLSWVSNFTSPQLVALMRGSVE
jgi:hypothetical protein